MSSYNKRGEILDIVIRDQLAEEPPENLKILLDEVKQECIGLSEDDFGSKSRFAYFLFVIAQERFMFDMGFQVNKAKQTFTLLLESGKECLNVAGFCKELGVKISAQPCPGYLGLSYTSDDDLIDGEQYNTDVSDKQNWWGFEIAV